MGKYTESPYNGTAVEKKLPEGQGVATFRYKYFPERSYNVANEKATKQYKMEVRLSSGLYEAMLGDEVYVQARLAGTKFDRGTAIKKESFVKDGDDYVFVVEKGVNATDTRDYLQPESSEMYPGITDVVVLIDENQIYKGKPEDQKNIELRCEVRFLGQNNLEVWSSRTHGYMVVEQYDKPEIQNIEKINSDKTGDVFTDELNKARITQKTLRGKAERAGTVERPDPNNSNKSIMEILPSLIIVKSSSNADDTKQVEGQYQANEDGSFTIEFDKTFEEMGFVAGDVITVQVFSIAAGKTISDPVEIELVDVPTNTPQGEIDKNTNEPTLDPVVYTDATQLMATVERHQYATDFTAEITLYTGADLSTKVEGTKTEIISGFDVQVTPDGKVSLNLPPSWNGKQEAGQVIELKLTEDTYLQSEGMTIRVTNNPANKSTAPTIDGPVMNTDKKITGTGVPGSKVKVVIPGDTQQVFEVIVKDTGKWELPDNETIDLTDLTGKLIEAKQTEFVKDKEKEESAPVVATIQQDPKELKAIFGRYFVETASNVYTQVNPAKIDEEPLAESRELEKVYIPYEENTITPASHAKVLVDGKYQDISIVPQTSRYIYNAELSTLPQTIDLNTTEEERQETQVYDVYYNANHDDTYKLYINVFYGEGNNLETYVKDAKASYIREVPKAFDYVITEQMLKAIVVDEFYVYKSVQPEIPADGFKFTKADDGTELKIYFEKQISEKPTIVTDPTDITKEIEFSFDQSVSNETVIKLLINGVEVEGATVEFNNPNTSTGGKVKLPQDVNLKVDDVITLMAQEPDKASSVSEPKTVTEKPFDKSKIASITIKKNPEKMNYDEGDDFEGTGMIVTLTDVNGKSKDVSFENFGDYQLTLENDKTLEVEQGQQTSSKEVNIVYEPTTGEDIKAPVVVSVSKTVVPEYPHQPEILTVYDTDKSVVVNVPGSELTSKAKVHIKLPGDDAWHQATRIGDTTSFKLDLDDVTAYDSANLVKDAIVEASVSDEGFQPRYDSTVVEEKPFDKSHVINLELVSGPDKDTYTEKDKFEPQGVIVKLTDRNGKVKEIAYADFAENNLSIDPVENQEFTETDQVLETEGTITFTEGDKTITVNFPLTVNPMAPSELPEIQTVYEDDKKIEVSIPSGVLDGTKVTLIIADGEPLSRTTENSKVIFDVPNGVSLVKDMLLKATVHQENHKPTSVESKVQPKVIVDYYVNRIKVNSVKGKTGEFAPLDAPVIDPNNMELVAATEGKRFLGWVENPESLDVLVNYKFKTEDSKLYAVWVDTDATKYPVTTETLSVKKGHTLKESDLTPYIKGVPSDAKIEFEEPFPSTNTDESAVTVKFKVIYNDGSNAEHNLSVNILQPSMKPTIQSPLYEGSTSVTVKIPEAVTETDVTSGATLTIMVQSEQRTYYPSNPQKIVNSHGTGPFTFNLSEPLKADDKVIAVFKENNKFHTKSDYVDVVASTLSVTMHDVFEGNEPNGPGEVNKRKAPSSVDANKETLVIVKLADGTPNESDSKLVLEYQIGNETESQELPVNNVGDYKFRINSGNKAIPNGTPFTVKYYINGTDNNPSQTLLVVKNTPEVLSARAMGESTLIEIKEPNFDTESFYLLHPAANFPNNKKIMKIERNGSNGWKHIQKWNNNKEIFYNDTVDGHLRINLVQTVVPDGGILIWSENALGNTTEAIFTPTREKSPVPAKPMQDGSTITSELIVERELKEGTEFFLTDKEGNKISAASGLPMTLQNGNLDDIPIKGTFKKNENNFNGIITFEVPKSAQTNLHGKEITSTVAEPARIQGQSEPSDALDFEAPVFEDPTLKLYRGKVGVALKPIPVQLTDGIFTTDEISAIKAQLPEGVNFIWDSSTSSGEIQGTPGVKGEFSITLTAKDNAGNKTVKKITLKVDPADSPKPEQLKQTKENDRAVIKAEVKNPVTSPKPKVLLVDATGNPIKNNGSDITGVIDDAGNITIPIDSIPDGTIVRIQYQEEGKLPTMSDELKVDKIAPKLVNPIADSSIDVPFKKEISNLQIEMDDTNATVEKVEFDPENSQLRYNEDTKTISGKVTTATPVNVKVTMTDDAGNSRVQEFVLNPIKENSAQATQLKQETNKLTATVPDGLSEETKYILVIDGEESTYTGTVSSGKVTFADLPEELHGKTVKVRIEEPDKNPTDSKETIVLDLKKPIIQITQHSPYMVKQGEKLSLNYTVSDDNSTSVNVSIDENLPTSSDIINQKLEFKPTTGTQTGDYSVTITATDKVGNKSEYEIQVTVTDGTAPAAPTVDDVKAGDTAVKVTVPTEPDAKKITVTLPDGSKVEVVKGSDGQWHEGDETGKVLTPQDGKLEIPVDGTKLNKDGEVKVTVTDTANNTSDETKKTVTDAQILQTPKPTAEAQNTAKSGAQNGKTEVAVTPAEGSSFAAGDIIRIYDENGTEPIKEVPLKDADIVGGKVKIDLGNELKNGSTLSVTAQKPNQRESIAAKTTVSVDDSEAKKAIGNTPSDLQNGPDGINDPNDKAVASAYKALKDKFTVEGNVIPGATQKEIDELTDILNDAKKARLEAKLSKIFVNEIETTNNEQDKLESVKAAAAGIPVESKKLVDNQVVLTTRDDQGRPIEWWINVSETLPSEGTPKVLRANGMVIYRADNSWKNNLELENLLKKVKVDDGKGGFTDITITDLDKAETQKSLNDVVNAIEALANTCSAEPHAVQDNAKSFSVKVSVDPDRISNSKSARDRSALDQSRYAKTMVMAADLESQFTSLMLMGLDDYKIFLTNQAMTNYVYALGQDGSDLNAAAVRTAIERLDEYVYSPQVLANYKEIMQSVLEAAGLTEQALLQGDTESIGVALAAIDALDASQIEFAEILRDYLAGIPNVVSLEEADESTDEEVTEKSEDEEADNNESNEDGDANSEADNANGENNETSTEGDVDNNSNTDETQGDGDATENDKDTESNTIEENTENADSEVDKIVTEGEEGNHNEDSDGNDDTEDEDVVTNYESEEEMTDRYIHTWGTPKYSLENAPDFLAQLVESFNMMVERDPDYYVNIKLERGPVVDGEEQTIPTQLYLTFELLDQKMRLVIDLDDYIDVQDLSEDPIIHFVFVDGYPEIEQDEEIATETEEVIEIIDNEEAGEPYGKRVLKYSENLDFYNGFFNDADYYENEITPANDPGLYRNGGTGSTATERYIYVPILCILPNCEETPEPGPTPTPDPTPDPEPDTGDDSGDTGNDDEPTTMADENDPQPPANRVPVRNKNRLTGEEKGRVASAIRDANPNLPSGTEIQIGDDGTATIIYPDGSGDVIPGDLNVTQIEYSGIYIPPIKLPGSTVVDSQTKQTIPAEKKVDSATAPGAPTVVTPIPATGEDIAVPMTLGFSLLALAIALLIYKKRH